MWDNSLMTSQLSNVRQVSISILKGKKHNFIKMINYIFLFFIYVLSATNATSLWNLVGSFEIAEENLFEFCIAIKLRFWWLTIRFSVPDGFKVIWIKENNYLKSILIFLINRSALVTTKITLVFIIIFFMIILDNCNNKILIKWSVSQMLYLDKTC